jgi:hypothetical protein
LGPLRVFLHLVVEDLGFASLGLGDQGIIKNLEDISANILQFILNLITVVLDDFDLAAVALGFLLLFDGGKNTP